MNYIGHAQSVIDIVEFSAFFSDSSPLLLSKAPFQPTSFFYTWRALKILSFGSLQLALFPPAVAVAVVSAEVTNARPEAEQTTLRYTSFTSAFDSSLTSSQTREATDAQISDLLHQSARNDMDPSSPNFVEVGASDSVSMQALGTTMVPNTFAASLNETMESLRLGEEIYNVCLVGKSSDWDAEEKNLQNLNSSSSKNSFKKMFDESVVAWMPKRKRKMGKEVFSAMTIQYIGDASVVLKSLNLYCARNTSELCPFCLSAKRRWECRDDCREWVDRCVNLRRG